MVKDELKRTESEKNNDYEELVNRLKKNDPTALNDLIEVFNGGLMHYATIKFKNIDMDIIVDSL